MKTKWGMHTKAGDKAVSDIVKLAYNYEDAIQRLELLAGKKGFAEAQDTAVKEEVHYHYHVQTFGHGTHIGTRYAKSQSCEVCGLQTHWAVQTNGRTAYWCGCGNKKEAG